MMKTTLRMLFTGHSMVCSNNVSRRTYLMIKCRHYVTYGGDGSIGIFTNWPHTRGQDNKLVRSGAATISTPPAIITTRILVDIYCL